MSDRFLLRLSAGLLVVVVGLRLLLFITGFVLVEDPGGAVARAAVADGDGELPLHRLPGGRFAGLPRGDGTVRIVCRDGTVREMGYVTGGLETRLRVERDGSCRLRDAVL